MSSTTSLHDELTAAQRCLDDLTRAVDRLEQHLGSGLEVRRVRSDAEHLRESLALLRAATSAAPAGAAASTAPTGTTSARPEMVTIPDKPYDHGLWSDVDDEGVGAKDRRAP
jgi:hypothetical protein